ncbi:MAG: diphthine--ammonia ligase [Chloroflexota bacterium]|nr:diphthine--ammonia ligase [Chloroflexota bacterium]
MDVAPCLLASHQPRLPEPPSTCMALDKVRAVLLWSGGKDSALALGTVLQKPDMEIAALVTTLTPDHQVSAHGVPAALIEEQARSLGLPLQAVVLPTSPSNQEYEARVITALAGLREEGVTTVVAGDLFLEDVRAYREKLIQEAGLSSAFPLWGSDTARLARTFVAEGFRAVVCAVDTHALSVEHAGRLYETALLDSLHPGVDPCGENGEFHTFVFDGPMFSYPVGYAHGRQSQPQGRFHVHALLPAPSR